MSLRGWMLFAAMGVIWGIPYLLIKVAVDEVSVPVLVFARSAIGAVLLLPLALSREARTTIVRHWKPVVAFAVVELVAAWLLLADAERHLTSSLTGLLIAATPIIAAILDRVTGGEHRLDAVQVIGLAVGLAGVAALAAPGISGGSAWPVTEVLLVAACYATGPLIAARYLADVPGPGLTAATLGLAALLCLPLAVPAWPREVPSGHALAAIIALAVVCTALAFIVFFALIREVGPTKAPIITYVNPAVALAAGVVVLREPVTWWNLLGLGLILAGSVWATRKSSASSAAPPEMP